MGSVPKALQVVFVAWSTAFTDSVFSKFMTLLQGAVLTTGRRTVSRILRLVGSLADAHPSSYDRVLSHGVTGQFKCGHLWAKLLAAGC